MSNTKQQARRDAIEFARAQMYYGEGAGIRRKLIENTVDSKSRRDPTYARTFMVEFGRQDMAEHAEKARKERERADRNASIKRNTRALTSGNYQNAQSSVLILLGVGYLAHKTGYDKIALEKGKELYEKGKLRVKQYRQKLRPVTDKD